MTPIAAYQQLNKLVGREFGPGEWIAVNSERIEQFASATGVRDREIEPFLLLSLLPHLASAISLPIPGPSTSVNYGLDSMSCHRLPAVGESIRTRMTLIDVAEASGGVQLRRRFVVEDESGVVLLEAVTLSRWLY